jgi:SAM-dependent methyltransferase
MAKLTPSDQKKIRAFYNNLLTQYGTKSARTLDWHGKSNQLERYETLEIIGDLNNKSVLDFGCGLGDFYGFLNKRHKGVKYTGIDLVSELVAEAKKKYPAGNFRVKDIFQIKKSYDYVFASGSLSYSVKGGREFYYNVIKKMYELCNIGVGFNMLDGHIYDSDETYQTYFAEEVLEFCKTFADEVRIVTEYEEGDFTVLLGKK